MVSGNAAEKQVQTAVRSAFVSGPFCMKQAATEDVPYARLRKVAAGEKCLRVWELREVLAGMLAADRCAALAFLDDVLGLRSSGVIVSAAPRVDGVPVSLMAEAVGAGAAVGAVQAAALAADADGVLSIEESQSLRALCRNAEREVAEVAAIAARSEVAHLDLPGAP